MKKNNEDVIKIQYTIGTDRKATPDEDEEALHLARGRSPECQSRKWIDFIHITWHGEGGECDGDGGNGVPEAHEEHDLVVRPP